MKRYFIVSCILLLLVSCSSANLGPKFNNFEKPNKNQALVYFYRPKGYVGSMVYYTVKDKSDNIPVVTLYNGGYYPYYTEEGQKTFTATTEITKSVSLDVKNGETYFVEGGAGWGFFIAHPKLNVVDKTEAVSSGIAQCKLIK